MAVSHPSAASPGTPPPGTAAQADSHKHRAWLRASTVDLAAQVARREIDPVELVETHIARIEQVNPAINAVVNKRYDDARIEAEAARKQLQQSATTPLPPLLGIPTTTKEYFAMKGMRQTGGLLARKDFVADHDGTMVQRMRDAGAIVLGSTNLPEGGMWMESDNPIYGRTYNPWDVRYTPGGSSGGRSSRSGPARRRTRSSRRTGCASCTGG